jgi:hypothetical protein
MQELGLGLILALSLNDVSCISKDRDCLKFGPEKDGLRAGILAIARTGPTTLSIDYDLRWVRENAFEFPRPFDRLYLQFCTENGIRIPDERREDFLVPRSFSQGQVKRFTTRLDVNIPAQAKYVTIELGSASVFTRKVTIPSANRK